MKKLFYLFTIILFVGLINVNAQTKSEVSKDLKTTKEYTNISAVKKAETGEQKAETTEQKAETTEAYECDHKKAASKKDCTKKQRKECKKKQESGTASKVDCPYHKAAMEKKEKEEQGKK